MSVDLVLKKTCCCCGSTWDLYGSNCKHLTICISCGKSMAEDCTKCHQCGATVTRLIREKYKNKPWLLEDASGQSQYQGVFEGAQSATYYLLMLQGKEFVAIPADSWYKFNKVAQYKLLTLEEAEQKMKNRRRAADGYERWMIKAANNGAAAFGEVENDDKENGDGLTECPKPICSYGDEANGSDKGEEDVEESLRKNRLGKKGGSDDEEGPRGGDIDFDDDDFEKGDDWEHEEMFTDDDEAVGDVPEDQNDLDPDICAPPKINQEGEDKKEGDVKEGGLSNSGRELMLLLGRTNRLRESDEENDDNDRDEDKFGASPLLPPSLNDSPAKETVSLGSAGGSISLTTSKSEKRKRKLTTDVTKSTTDASSKKMRTKNKVKSEKEETDSTFSVPPSTAQDSGSTVNAALVTEDEIRAVLLQGTPMTAKDFVTIFKTRLQSQEEKETFTAILRRISIKGKGGYLVLKKE